MIKPQTIAQQITAVEWAARHVDAKKGRIETHAMRESEREFIEAALSAAVETLRAVEYERGTLR
jgi:hypothetical protein